MELERIKSNVAKMVDQGAPESDIDAYIQAEGTTVDDVKNFAPAKTEYTKLESFFGGGGQGATGGTSDEIMGAFGGDPEAARLKLKHAQEQNPISYGLGEVAGAVSGAMVGGPILSKAAPGITNAISQAVGKNLATRAVGSSAIGGISGGTYGFNTGGGDASSRMQNAETGAAMGMAAGPVGSLVGNSVSKVGGSLAERAKRLFARQAPVNEFVSPMPIEQITQMGTPAVTKTTADQSKGLAMISDAIRKDFPNNADQVLNSIKNGEVSLSDIISDKTPALKGLAVGSSQYPQGRAVAEQALAIKMGDRGTRVSNSMSRNIADFGGFHGTVDDIVSKGQEKAKPLYDQAYEDVIKDNNILIVPEIQDALKKAYAKYPSELQGAAPNSIKALDYAKKVLDDDIGAAQRTGEKNFARSRTSIKNQLLSAMDDASPTYKEARSTAGDYLSIQSAADEGKNAFKTRPELVKDYYNKLGSEAEKSAYKMGVVESLRTDLDRMPFSVDPYKKIMGTDGNKQRLGALLSPQEYKSFEQDLRSEQRLFKLYADTLGNSNTASKLKASAQFDESGLADMVLSPKTTALSGLKSMVTKAFDGISDNTAGIVADAIYETNPTKKLAIIQKLKPKEGVLTPEEVSKAKSAIAELEKSLRKTRVNVPGAAAAGVVANPNEAQ